MGSTKHDIHKITNCSICQCVLVNELALAVLSFIGWSFYCVEVENYTSGKKKKQTDCSLWSESFWWIQKIQSISGTNTKPKLYCLTKNQFIGMHLTFKIYIFLFQMRKPEVRSFYLCCLHLVCKYLHLYLLFVLLCFDRLVFMTSTVAIFIC